MTKAQHTPGPWEIYQNSICTSDGKANEIAKLTCYGVWMNDGSPYGPRNPIGQANLRLIASAPDLLLALENMVAHFPFWASKLEMKQIDRDAVALARAAIAKAKGIEQ